MVLSSTRSMTAACVLTLVLGGTSLAAQLVDGVGATEPDAASLDETRADDAAPEPDRMAAFAEIDRALVSLDTAIVQQLQWELWDQVEVSATEGLAAIARARRLEAPAELCVAVRETLQGLIDRQGDIVAKAMAAEGEAPGNETLEAVSERLAFVEGRLPQTSFLLAASLFELMRDDEAQAVLARALVLWPGNARLHDQARTWIDVLPAPAVLVTQLVSRAEQTGLGDTDTSAIALETAGLLEREIGRRLYDGGRPVDAAPHFERAVSLLGQSRSMPRALPARDVAVLSANALVSATYAHLQAAKNRWYEFGHDDETAAAAAARAEELLVRALEMDRENREANERAVLHLGDGLMTRGGKDPPRPSDIESMRDFYGRMAERFDVADWWNNFAFWSRETGTAASNQGDETRATELFEQSYEAYTNAIRLDPDNARFVNDTGLMLFYHLGRDLELAEQHFLRAWELGKAVCDNPFVEEAVYEENFSAYTDAMLNLARLYNVQGDYDRAAEIANELLALAPNRIDAQMTQREIESARGAKTDG